MRGEGFDLGELRSIQGWFVRYQLQAVGGVSEVASIGGFVPGVLPTWLQRIQTRIVMLQSGFRAMMA